LDDVGEVRTQAQVFAGFDYFLLTAARLGYPRNCYLQNDGTRLDSEMVEIVLLTLPPRLQTVLTLRYLAEMSVKEIAEVVNCRLGTVKSRLSRGRKLMRERLSNEQGEVILKFLPAGEVGSFVNED